MLKGRDDGDQLWRENFDLQAGSIWAWLEKFLEEVRDSKAVVTEAVYMKWLEDGFGKRAIGDWAYENISRKLYMVLHTHRSTDVKKIISESIDKCGFEAYRLLSREFDPLSVDLAYSLLERVLVIASWQIKNVEDET